ncbi:MAG: TonB family protein, partial [Chitinivibrionales bacterium]|nr:TonB family protein [Chitinivibrionales bacterium]
DLTGEKTQMQRAEIDRINNELQAQGKLSSVQADEIRRKLSLSENPFRRPSFLKKVIDDNSSQLKYLYNKRLRSGVKLNGKMWVEMKITAAGKVAAASVVSSSLGDALFEKEVVNSILAWQFKPVTDSLGDLTIKCPFDFSEDLTQ